MSTPVTLLMKDSVAILTLNRPERYNAFDPETIRCLGEMLALAAKDDRIHAMILTGSGKAFCAGGNLKAILSSDVGPGAAFHAMAPLFHMAIVEMRRTPKPVIAAINGIAAGGGFSLALAADFRVMGRNALLKHAYLSAGLCPDGGGSFMLPRLIGMAKALEVATFDEPINAIKAMEWGLVTRVVEDELVLDEALSLAGELLDRSCHAFGWTKRLINDSYGHSLEEHLEIERQGIADCGGHPEGIEGLTAFVEKRPPRFRKTE